MSVKTPYSDEWKSKVRTRIRRSDGVLVLVSRNSARSSGQQWEVECAKDEGKPILGIWAYSNDRSVIDGVRTVSWSDYNISTFIDSL
ncbi:TIR domain-containing protein [Actinomyces oris]|nr:TIR domain-containing protein [Actinomyces oris]WCA43774.1 TIR domain-containing protein [Actinomyces oris]